MPALFWLLPGQPQSLGGAIEAAIEAQSSQESAKRRELGLQIAARYTWETAAEAHVGVYRLAAGR